MPRMLAGRAPQLDAMRLACFLAVAVLAGSLLMGCAPEKSSTRPISIGVGEAAPDFSLVTVKGEVYRLEQFHGRPVIVYFWTTWCETCREEMSALADRYESNKLRGPMILAVNSEEEASVVADFAQNSGMPFPLLVDIDGRVGDLFGMETIPTTYLIDANGYVQQINAGTMTVDLIDSLMAAKAPQETRETPTITETPEPTVPPTATSVRSLTACVTTGVLNVRNGPSATAPVVDGMGKGECAEVDARSQDSEWLRFKDPIAGGRGWAAAKFLALDSPLDGLKIAE